MKVVSVISKIEHLENDYFLGLYSVSTKSNVIGSTITFDSKNMIIELKQNDGNERYISTWEVKTLEKAVNLLLRAERDFKGFDERHSCPLLRTMENDYKNYFSGQSEKSIVFDY